MTEIKVPMHEEQIDRLRGLAKQAGVTIEELARVGLEQWLNQPQEDFLRAADHVLKKNAELYRRLA